MDKQTQITYFIPKDNGFQVALNKRKPRPAFNLLKNWLITHTEYKFEPEIKFEFWIPGEALNSLKGKALINEIGTIEASGGAIAPNGSVVSSRLAYKYPFERLFEIIDLTERNQDILRSTMYSYYSVSACAKCLFFDPKGKIVSGQSYDENLGLSSLFTIHLSNSSALWPDFHLPFDNLKDFLVFYELIKYDLPFKARDKYWKLLTYNKKTDKTTVRTLFRGIL
jgi:hypothetical protein